MKQSIIVRYDVTNIRSRPALLRCPSLSLRGDVESNHARCKPYPSATPFGHTPLASFPLSQVVGSKTIYMKKKHRGQDGSRTHHGVGFSLYIVPSTITFFLPSTSDQFKSVIYPFARLHLRRLFADSPSN